MLVPKTHGKHLEKKRMTTEILALVLLGRSFLEFTEKYWYPNLVDTIFLYLSLREKVLLVHKVALYKGVIVKELWWIVV